MKYNVQDVKKGDKVFVFGYSEFPTVAEVERTTENFVFVRGQKFRRDGSSMEKFSKEHVATIEPGDVEDYAKKQNDRKRIQEIIQALNTKGFTFRGYPQWYPIETWEKLAAVFGPEQTKENE